MRRPSLVLASILILSGLLCPGSLSQAQTGPTIEVRAGFDGYYKMNSWAPVHVSVANEGSDIEGYIELGVEDPYGGRVLYTQRATLPDRSRKQFALYVFIENYVRELSVQLVQQDHEIARRRVELQPLTAETFLLGVVSDDPSALDYLAGLPPIGKKRIHVAHTSLSDIPAQGRALEGIDALIVHYADTSALSDEQLGALRDWVALGGHLITCGGPHAKLTASGLGDLVPVQIVGSETTTDIGALGDLAGAPFIPGLPAVVARVAPVADPGGSPDAYILAGRHDLPLLVRRDLARGSLDYLALDPGLEPLRTWVGSSEMWTQLLAPQAAARSSMSLPSYPGSWANIQGALANIPGLQMPSVLLVMAFLFAYVAVIGPLNFLILRLADRRALAWITVPAVILVFSCIAYVAGVTLRGQKVILSEITLVQSPANSPVAQVDSFVGLYSPTRRTYDVRLPDHSLIYRAASDYYGAGSGSQEALRVEQGPPTYLRHLDVDVGGMGRFAAQTAFPWRGIEAHLVLSRTTPSGYSLPAIYRLEGNIVNQSDADVRGSALVFGSMAIELGDLAAGEARSIAADFTTGDADGVQRLIETLLGGQAAKGQSRQEQERRRALLNGLFLPYMYGPYAQKPPLSGLTLVGWLGGSMLQVEVPGLTSEVHATTLLIAPLPVSPGNENAVFAPKGFLPWVLVDGDPNAAPYALYQNQSTPTFRFYLTGPQMIAGAGDTVVEQLTLHVDTAATALGPPPTISIKTADNERWVSLAAAAWGENPLPDPQSYVQSFGPVRVVEIQVETQTIASGPVSVDLSFVGSRH